MEALQALPSITRISKNVVRVLGQNPSKFHLQGTNVYLIGQRNPYIIVDTGEGLPEFIPYLEDALQNNGNPFNPEEVDVSDIIITHRHLDHTGGLPTVLAMLRKRQKFSKNNENYEKERANTRQ
ncbi:hypothetical protein NM688_g5198 [Phlebia brevispora]|uniref:Uncharacterized protein n=1 Tax=Phlebia brevispora TaxID=194682 RepID=A0ACC1SYT2_9APHY|nr:hypothetical protein NM688_g5198 [Phlebia brevispora]